MQALLMVTKGLLVGKSVGQCQFSSECRSIVTQKHWTQKIPPLLLKHHLCLTSGKVLYLILFLPNWPSHFQIPCWFFHTFQTPLLYTVICSDSILSPPSLSTITPEATSYSLMALSSIYMQSVFKFIYSTQLCLLNARHKWPTTSLCECLKWHFKHCTPFHPSALTVFLDEMATPFC